MHAPSAPKRHLAIYLAAALAIVLFASSVFGWIARRAVTDSAVQRLDARVAYALHDAASPDGVEFFKLLTAAGGKWGVVTLAAVVGVALALRRRYLWALGWVLSLGGGALLGSRIKLLWRRPRPHLALIPETGWSFPSAHASGSVIAYGLLAYLLVKLEPHPKRRVAIVAAAGVWAGLIGFSRMYLGVHYLSDVVGGFLLGLLWLAICVTAFEVATAHRGRDAHRAMVEREQAAAEAGP